MIHLHEYFLFSKKFNYFLPGRISQDCIENLFCTVRVKQSKPSALIFKNTLKTISLCQFMKNPKNSSYENDEGFYLSGFLDVIKESRNKEAALMVELSELPPSIYNNIENTILGKYELMVLYRISGCIIHRIRSNKFKVCDDCFKPLGSYTPKNTAYSKLTFLKQHSKDKMFYPSESVFIFFRKMENVFQFYKRKYGIFSNIKDSLKLRLMEIPDDQFESCHNIKERLVANFILFRLRSEGRKRLRGGQVNYSSMSMN